MKFKFGQTLKDVVSGLQGVYIAWATYITGCNQCLLQPSTDDPSKKAESYWFDEDRLVLAGDGIVELPDKNANGPDRDAPKI